MNLRLFLSILFIYTGTYSYTQQLKLDKGPEDYQLFARDKNDSATVLFSGKVTETLNPVICESDLNGSINIKKGEARGVEQVACGYLNNEVVIEMQFKAAIGEARSFDKIEVDGIPSFVSEIEGGINGDIATCSIAINSVKSILKANPGFHTMSDIVVPGYIN